MLDKWLDKAYVHSPHTSRILKIMSNLIVISEASSVLNVQLNYCLKATMNNSSFEKKSSIKLDKETDANNFLCFPHDTLHLALPASFHLNTGCFVLSVYMSLRNVWHFRELRSSSSGTNGNAGRQQAFVSICDVMKVLTLHFCGIHFAE